MDIATARENIAELGEELYQRFLTDSTGGNLSMRIGDTIVMTPRFAGSHFHWHLKPNQVLVLDLNGQILDGEGELSREARTHFALLGRFYPEANAVVHTHPRHVMVFCAAEQPMPPVLQCTEPLGTLGLCHSAPSESQALADAILENMLAQSERLSQVGVICCMAPRHGLFVLAQDLLTGFEVTERLDTNAYCILHADPLGGVNPIGSNQID